MYEGGAFRVMLSEDDLMSIDMKAVHELMDAMMTGRELDGECRPQRNERIVREFVDLHIKCTGAKPSNLPAEIIDILDWG